MSILADLLSKARQPAFKREVAPNLKNIVKASSGRAAHKIKIIVLSAIFIVSVLSGVFFVQYVKSISGRSDINIAPASRDIVRQNVREKQPAGSETPGLQQDGDNEASDKQHETQAETQPAVSEDNKSGATITEEKFLMPVVVSASKDNREGLQRLPVRPDGEGLESGTSDNTVMNDTAGNSVMPVKENIPDSHPAPAGHAEGADTRGMDAYLYRAREYEIKGDYSRALTNYKKALELDRSNFAVMNNVAYIFLRLNLIDESIMYSRMAADINGDYTPAIINLGIAYAKSGDLANARERLERAFILEPDNKNVVLNLAVLHERQGRFEEAAEYFSRLVKSGSIDGSMGLARIYEKQGMIDGAVRLYRSVYENSSADEAVKSRARQRIMVLKNNRQ